jgi:PAS domain S-box-containing protein
MTSTPSDDRYRVVVETAADPIVFADATGTITFLNAAARAAFGYSSEEIIGQPLAVIVPERLRHAHEQPLGQLLRTGEARVAGKTQDLVGRRKDGTEFPLEISLATGTVDGEAFFTAILRDITYRKRAHDALRASEKMYRSIVALAHEGIWIVDASSRTTFANRRVEEMLGYEPGEMNGKHVAEFLDEEGRVGLETRLRQRQRGEAGQFDLRFRRKDGTAMWALMKSVPMQSDDGQYAGVLAMLTDITDRVRGDTSLRQSERNFRSLVERLPGHVFVHRDGVVVYANAAFLEWLGYGSLQEVVGRAAVDAFAHPDERERLRERIRNVSLGGQSPRFDARLVRRDGSVRMVESMTVRLDFDGAPSSVILVRDVTEERALQQRLVLAERMASMGTLAAGVAHEINNPLAYVTWNLEALEEEVREAADGRLASERPQLQKTISEARDGVDRVRKIVRGLKTFSRPEEDERTPIDLREVLDLAVNMTFNELRHRAQLVKDYRPTPAVLGNEGRLGQVFINLLLNAAQAIPEGHASSHEIRVVTLTDASGRAVVEVKDTGSGIQPDVLGRIFDPFFTTKAVGEGTGLGLSISHSIVTSLGGEIAADSAPGEGAVFRVVLPAATPEIPGVATPGAPAPSEVGRRGKVLVVDDDSALGASLARILSKEHDVTHVAAGREALERLLGGEHFDVVLCDLMMPEMTGMELHAELARTLPLVGERFVFMTGGAFTPTAQAFLDRVPNTRLHKPFNLQELRRLVLSRVR